MGPEICQWLSEYNVHNYESDLMQCRGQEPPGWGCGKLRTPGRDARFGTYLTPAAAKTTKTHHTAGWASLRGSWLVPCHQHCCVLNMNNETETFALHPSLFIFGSYMFWYIRSCLHTSQFQFL